MEKVELQANLNYLVSKYIKDDYVIEQLKTQIVNNKAKYVLTEIDRNKVEAFSEEDIDLMKDIAFYFC